MSTLSDYITGALIGGCLVALGFDLLTRPLFTIAAVACICGAVAVVERKRWWER